MGKVRRTTIGKPLSRRTALRGILGGSTVTVALPTLDWMLNDSGTAYADGTNIPTRYGFWWWGNGVRQEHWMPDRDGADFDLKAETMPFAGVKEYMTLLSGYDLPSNENVHNTGHAWLTGGHSDHSHPYHVNGDLSYSHDQIVADAWAGQTPIHSLQLGVSRMGYEGSRTNGDTSWGEGGRVRTAEFNPQDVFDRIFAGVGDEPDAVAQELARARGRRASVLDAVLATARSLEGRVGAHDRARLDEHFTGIRELEMRLRDGASVPTGMGCNPVRPTATGTEEGQHNSPEPLEETHDAMAEVVRLAFACDVTRVFSLQYIKQQGSTVFGPVGTSRQFHDITHDGPQSLVHEIDVFMFSQLARLLEGLRDTPCGAQSLLHYCTIVGTSEVSEGGSHSGSNIPIVFFGRGGGRLAGNRHIRGGGTSTSAALLAAIRSVGVSARSFGANEGRATDPASGII